MSAAIGGWFVMIGLLWLGLDIRKAAQIIADHRRPTPMTPARFTQAERQ